MTEANTVKGSGYEGESATLDHLDAVLKLLVVVKVLDRIGPGHANSTWERHCGDPKRKSTVGPKDRWIRLSASDVEVAGQISPVQRYSRCDHKQRDG